MSNPKPFGVNELREMFLSFFESKGHLRLPSFSLIPQNDASLLHGTYFEMLGNFSFGDYFKREAITWCWEFLTSPEWVGLDPNRLYPSIYEDDDEAFEIWNKEIGIPAERIFRFGKADNFWEHGSGPCGPCSEVYYDRGEEYGCGKPGCTVGCDCDRYMEVWNNVFSQFNNDGEGHYTELIQKNIDTGMGLERLACVCQNVGSLFDTDTVMNITNKVSEITGAHYGQSESKDVSLRIITDHIRSATMMICDGVLPSNEGRGYVLRRLLRRAARHGKLLGVNDPFLYRVCDTVIEVNATAYPDLVEKQSYITKVIRVEEENFAKTIDSGLKIFSDMLAQHKAKGETVFSGEDAFKLYDTYGFPIDLTSEMAQDEGLTVDEAGFRAFMEEQKVRARKAREALGDLGWAGIEFGKELPETEFVGYDHNTIDDAKVLAMVVENVQAEEMMSGVEGIVVLDRTPFYAEMGGQVGDHGTITLGEAVFTVHDVQKNKGGKYMHYGKLTGGVLKVGDTVTAAIDVERRQAIRRAHSATHLLDAALKKVLGDHVHQAGSLVEPDRIRFDFTHFEGISAEELAQVDKLVNDAILNGYPVITEVLPIEEAKKKGAVAMFGEKYGDVVRVVEMGGFSMEFCGGTHLDNTAKVGTFRIKSEGSVASGVRRIEATVGKLTLEAMNHNQQLIFQAAQILKTNPADLAAKLEQQVADLKAARQAIEQYKSKEAAGEADRILFGAHDVGPLKVITATVPDADGNRLRQMGDAIKDKAANVVAVLAAVNGGKITFVAACGKEAVGLGIKAGDIIKQVSAIAGGSGGGKPDSAMGGGKDPLMVDNALAMVDNVVSMKLGL